MLSRVMFRLKSMFLLQALSCFVKASLDSRDAMCSLTVFCSQSRPRYRPRMSLLTLESTTQSVVPRVVRVNIVLVVDPKRVLQVLRPLNLPIESKDSLDPYKLRP